MVFAEDKGSYFLFPTSEGLFAVELGEPGWEAHVSMGWRKTKRKDKDRKSRRNTSNQ